MAWFAVLGFLFQLFLVANHVHLDEDSWTGLSPLAGATPLLAHHHDISAHRHDGGDQWRARTAALHTHTHKPGASAEHAIPADNHAHIKHPDCQVCQSAPIVSASLVPVTRELTPAILGTGPRLRHAESDARPVEHTRSAQPRAPPSQA